MFAANGINPVVSTLNNGATIVQSVVGGDLDVGETNPFQLAVAIARGIPLQMIAPACLYTKSVANPNVVVAKNSPIKSPKDLAGATIGVGSLGDFNQLSLWAWLDATACRGRTSSTSSCRSRKSVRRCSAARSKPASSSSRPRPTRCGPGDSRFRRHVHRARARDRDDGVVHLEDLAAKKPGRGEESVKAIYATGRWANTHGPEAAAIIAKSRRSTRPSWPRSSGASSPRPTTAGTWT